MADTKYPTIRYQTLDRCFRNKYKRYYIEDLIDACAEAIYVAQIVCNFAPRNKKEPQKYGTEQET